MIHKKAAATLYLNGDQPSWESFLISPYAQDDLNEYLARNVIKRFKTVQISLHFIHNTTITTTPTNPQSKWQEETRGKISTLVETSPKSPPLFLVKNSKISIHLSSTYLSIYIHLVYLSIIIYLPSYLPICLSIYPS